MWLYVVATVLAAAPVVAYFALGKKRAFRGMQSLPSKAFSASEDEGILVDENPVVSEAPRRMAGHESALVVAPANLSTLYDVFTATKKATPQRQCIGYRKTLKKEEIETEVEGVKKKWIVTTLADYSFLTYGEVGRKAANIGEGLRRLGLKAGDKFGIYEDTRMEWMLAAQACFSVGITVVTVYTNLGDDALLHALNEGELTMLLTNGRNIKKLIELVGADGSKCPSLTTIVYTDKASEQPEGSNHHLVGFDELERKSSKYMAAEATPAEPQRPSPTDLAVIMYTSGSTGNPKGVMLSHQNLCGAIAGFRKAAEFFPDDVYIAYLPLAHVLELVAEMTLISVGACIGYAGVRTLVDNPTSVRPCGDLTNLRPTLMAGVPTVYDRVKKGALAKVKSSSPMVQWLFNMAYTSKKQAVAEGRSTPLWDMLVFNKLRKLLGGRVRRLLSGGAPLSKDTDEFLRVAFSCPISQGYGLTETCGCCTIMHEHDVGFTRTGRPVPCCEVRLVDVPDMKYLSSDRVGSHGEPVLGRGEVWIRGQNIALGYYKLEKKTAEEFTKPGDYKNGWFKTGDIGQWTKEGALQIVDRKKNLVKLSQGEYIALEKLESIARNSPYVDNVCVYGDSEESFAVCVVVPSEKALLDWVNANTSSKKGEIDDEVCALEAAENEVLKSIRQCCADAKLKPFEVVKNLRLTSLVWTPENGMLSSSNKLKRPELKERYMTEIKAMYKQGMRR